MQRPVGVAAGEVAEEGQELLVPVPRLAQPGDLADSDLERGEQSGGGAVPRVVRGALLGLPGMHRQRLWIRSKAWIWNFSSLLSTIAFSGGLRYNPTTSLTLAAISGSVENLNVSARQGCTR
jgi:hypothetical protein